jgi:UPF0716 protein FxsA
VGLLFLAFTLVPLLELFLLVRLGRIFGAGPILLLVIASALLGAFLAKHEGRRVLDQWRNALAQGQVPTDGVFGGFLVLVGGFLLIIPGVITDVAGLVLLVPWTRRAVASVLRRSLERQMANGTLHVQGFGFGGPPPGFGGPPRDVPRYPTELGRGPARRSGDVVDTEGEEIR